MNSTTQDTDDIQLVHTEKAMGSHLLLFYSSSRIHPFRALELFFPFPLREWLVGVSACVYLCAQESSPDAAGRTLSIGGGVMSGRMDFILPPN